MEYVDFVNIEIGNRIREIRVRKGLTQAELAKRSSIDPSTISRLEEGRRSPNTHTLFRLSECLDVHLIDILDIRNEYFEEHTDAFLLEECVRLLKKLDPEEQDAAMSMLRIFVSMKRKTRSSKKRKPEQPAK